MTFPLIDLAGSILSKCESVSVKKRPRDAFDIFIAIESDIEKTIPGILHQHKHLDGVKNLLEKLSEFVGAPPLALGLALNQFDMNVYKYIKAGQLPGLSPAARVQAALKDV